MAESKITSDDELPDLPTELCREILSRLPAKTLMRLRCVCKTWCSLIDSSDFIPFHLQIYNNNRSQSYLLAADWGKRYSIHSSDTLRKIDVLVKIPDYCFVLGSCYGLILIRYFSVNIIGLYNPFIRKLWLIPSWPFISIKHNFLHYWLGFVPSMNDYKLLAIGFIKSTEYSIAVYSLNDHLWRIKDGLDVHIQGILSFYLGNVIHLKGSMYCLGFDWYSSDPASGLQTHLVSFDFDSEEFGFVELPDAAKKNKVKFNFVLGESVAVFSMSSEHTCIWVLIEVGGEKSWRLLYNGDSNLTALQFLKSSTFTKIIHVEENTFFVQRSPNLYSYNFRSHLIQHLDIDGCKSLETFVESLVLHKGNQGKNLSHETDFIQINGE